MLRRRRQKLPDHFVFFKQGQRKHGCSDKGGYCVEEVEVAEIARPSSYKVEGSMGAPTWVVNAQAKTTKAAGSFLSLSYKVERSMSDLEGVVISQMKTVEVAETSRSYTNKAEGSMGDRNEGAGRRMGL
jgi:hypothetical protein